MVGSQNIWIGLTDEVHEGRWEWVNGESLVYTNWDSEEPNNSGAGEDYGMMYSDGSWNDAGPPGTPNEEQFYVCEWEEETTSISESKTSTTSIPTLTPGFQLFSLIIFIPMLLLIIVKKSKTS